MIVKEKTIYDLFFDRGEKGEIEIAPNTKALPLIDGNESQAMKQGTLFTCDVPDLSAKLKEKPGHEELEQIRQRIDGHVKQVCIEASERMSKLPPIEQEIKQKKDLRLWKDCIAGEGAIEYPIWRSQDAQAYAAKQHGTMSSDGERLKAAKEEFEVKSERLDSLHKQIQYLRRRRAFSGSREQDESVLKGLVAEKDRPEDEMEDFRLTIVDLEEHVTSAAWARTGDFVFAMDKEEIEVEVPEEEERLFDIYIHRSQRDGDFLWYEQGVHRDGQRFERGEDVQR